MATSALIALGSNLGDRKATLDAAVARLSEVEGVRLRRVSSYHETDAAGGPSGQGAYLNAAVLLLTRLAPDELLRVLQSIERQFGRVRTVRWGERTLDLDIILFGKQRVDLPHLVIPHPRMPVRRFVLAPAAEVAPGMVDPGTGRTLLDLLANLDRRPSHLALIGPRGSGYRAVFDRVATVLAGQSVQGLRTPGDELLVAAPQSGPSNAFGDQYESALRALDQHSHAGGGWLVSDFWIDEFHISAQLRFASSSCQLLPFHDAFVQGRARLLPPTFVAFWDPPEDTWLDHIACDLLDGSTDPQIEAAIALRLAGWSRLRRAIRDYATHALRRDPILLIETPSPTEAANEILAACGSTR